VLDFVWCTGTDLSPNTSCLVPQPTTTTCPSNTVTPASTAQPTMHDSTCHASERTYAIPRHWQWLGRHAFPTTHHSTTTQGRMPHVRRVQPYNTGGVTGEGSSSPR
jgi:hypothetical protein